MAASPRALRDMTNGAMIADRKRLRARIRRLEGRPGALDALKQDIEASVDRRRRRAEQTPKVTYPPELPVSARVEDIGAAIRDHQAVVVCGETGSGKTTQLPKILLEMGIGAAGIIGHTQPRRLAARSVATRIADELGVTLGGVVGSKVRFNDRTSQSTLIKLMTDGILLSEMQSDRDLDAYEAIIIDEAHERSLNIDLLLGCLKQIMTRRHDLKIVVTSATIDPGRFSRHLAGPRGPAPVIEVSGRTYPVEIRYRATVDKDDRESDLDHLAALLDAVDELCAKGPGDILVFEPGEREIRDAAAALSRHLASGTDILPLYGRLAHHEQDRVFAPHTGRRIVIATNVAETSLTVPGIRYVIDGGTARISRYSARSKLQRLEVEPISRASARQRAGRCGRTSEGVCVRLYDEGDLQARDEFTPPEILRSNLASVILHMKALRLGSIDQFPFIEPPDRRQISDGLEMLTELDALDDRGELTEVGKALSRLPVDPKLGRMLIEADRRGALAEVLVIVAALSVQDPRDRPFEQREQADLAHETFEHPDSDFLALLNIWRFYQDLDAKLGASRLRKACRERFLSYMRLREWRDIHRQLRLLLGAMGYHAATEPADDDAIHQSLVVGLLDNLGCKRREGDYEGLRQQKFRLFPGTGIAGKPAWIMAAEIVRTSRVYARTCARIDPAWIEQAVGDRVKRSYAEPQWDARAGRIVASERATYRGLELHRGRIVHYGPIDPAASRDMFIRCALVEGGLRPPPEFLEHNERVIEQLKSLEARLRAEGSLASDDAVFAYYDARIPDDIHNAPRFRRWLKSARRENERVLHMDRADFVGDDVQMPEGLPDRSDVLGVGLDITYTNEPGRSHDGARVDVLLHELPRLVAEAEPFLIPAWLEERVKALLRALPKAYRRRIDIPVAASRAVEQLRPDAGPLTAQLADVVRRSTGIDIPPDEWDQSRVPQYLRATIRVIDDDGAALGEARDIEELKRRFADLAREKSRSLKAGAYPVHGLTGWTFDDPPERVRSKVGGRTFEAFTAIIDNGDTVSIELRPDQALADLESRAGVRRLCAHALRDVVRFRDDTRIPRLTMLYATIGDRQTLEGDLRLAVAQRACDLDRGLPRTRTAFEASVRQGKKLADRAVDTVLDLAGDILTERQRVALLLERDVPPAWAPCIEDIRAQLAGLVTPRFLVHTPAPWLTHVPRFLRGMHKRIEKLGNSGLERDSRRMAEMRPALAAFVARRRHLGTTARTDPALLRARWLIEELRISLFAQELRTSEPASVERVIQSMSGEHAG